MDREKVIKGLECCIGQFPGEDYCKTCAYQPYRFGKCKADAITDALTLLKEQEAVEPYVDFDGHDVWRCGKCGTTIFHVYHNASDEDAKNYAKFCRHCGQAVKWK